MLSTGLIDSFTSQIDIKGKIGPASLKENVCQVRVSIFFLLNTSGNFFIHFSIQERKFLDTYVIVYMYFPEGV